MKNLIPFLVLATVFFSCKKDKEETTKPSPQQDVIYANYTHLKPGSYWIYQIFEVGPDGTATPTSIYDSIYAGAEKEINGKVYQTRMIPDGSGYIPVYTRDSFTYRVRNNGTVDFSFTDFKTIFYSKHFIAFDDTVALVEYQMTDKDLRMAVPAGSFVTNSYTETWNMYPDYATHGAKRKLHTRYNIDIGIVSETLPFYLDNANLQERRLVRYRLVK